MTIYALVSENPPIRLWGLDPAERLHRQLRQISKEHRGELSEICWLNEAADVPETGRVLLLNGNFLFENRTLEGLLEQPDTVLLHGDHTAAAFVSARHLGPVLEHLRGSGKQLPADLHSITPGTLEAFDENLRRSTKPLLEPVTAERKSALENELYGNAYRGITDLVTKFAWPKPARRAVHLCANLHVTPNMVTGLGLVLVVAACFLFLHGHYGWGLLAGWAMTFLDTVDGKLARVTIQSSKLGHLFDHAIDLFHPPFWYIFWGMSLLDFQAALGVELPQMYWIIIAGYVVGRVVEGIFPLLGNCSIFTWRPFDAWFRLITARRNPNLILLTLSVFVAKPDWGFLAVVFWTAFTSAILVLRLAYAGVIRLTRGALTSWLGDDDVANGPHARSYAIFGATRGAYARGE